MARLLQYTLFLLHVWSGGGVSVDMRTARPIFQETAFIFDLSAFPDQADNLIIRDEKARQKALKQAYVAIFG